MNYYGIFIFNLFIALFIVCFISYIRQKNIKKAIAKGEKPQYPTAGEDTLLAINLICIASLSTLAIILFTYK